MYVELTCHSCKEHFAVPFAKDEVKLEKCPQCGAPISFTDEQKVRLITETVFRHAEPLDDITINCIYPRERFAEKISTSIASLFKQDVTHLVEAYNGAELEIQKKMESIMDTVFLLIYHDVTGGNLNRLGETEAKIRKIFLEALDANREAAERLLLGNEVDRNE